MNNGFVSLAKRNAALNEYVIKVLQECRKYTKDVEDTYETLLTHDTTKCTLAPYGMNRIAQSTSCFGCRPPNESLSFQVNETGDCVGLIQKAGNAATNGRSYPVCLRAAPRGASAARIEFCFWSNKK